MRVLVITGDKRFGPGHPRYDLQKPAVDVFEVVYWGRGALFPKLPEGPFDVVSAQDPLWRGLFGWYVARKMCARFNVQVHMDLEPLSGVRRTLAALILGRADSIRVVSDKIKTQVGKFGAKAPVTVLPVFVELEKFKSVVREPHEGKVILWVGRFEPEKDPTLAIEVLKKVLAQGIDARLILLGAGSLEPVLRAAATNMPVDFPGWQSPALYLAKADVVLSTSKHESWGESMIEALAAGVPVVAPDVGVAKEAGATVVPRHELADAVVQVLTSAPRAQLQLTMPSREEWLEQWQKSLN
jgi:glycosyltransferase involved in cell wall biosynthesis